MEFIDRLFWICVEIIRWFGEITGMGYNLANIVLFVILQPGLIDKPVALLGNDRPAGAILV